VRDRVRIYCDTGQGVNPGDEATKDRSLARIKEIMAMGFTAMKIDIDAAGDPARFDRVNWTASNTEIEHMVAKVAFMREAIGKSIDLPVDMHGRYDAATAKRVAKEVEPFQAALAGEPVPPENIDAMRDVRASTSTPSAAAKTFSFAGFPRVVRKAGGGHHHAGLPEVRRPARSAQDLRHGHAYYIPVAPHAVTSPIGMMATAHVCAAIPNFLVQEWHWIDSLALWKELGEGGRDHRKGLHRPARASRARRGDERRRGAQGAGRGHPWFEPARG